LPIHGKQTKVTETANKDKLAMHMYAEIGKSYSLFFDVDKDIFENYSIVFKRVVHS